MKETNPWTVWRTQFFNDCRIKGEKPWANTGLHPMTYASNLYQEMLAMNEAMETIERPIDEHISIDDIDSDRLWGDVVEVPTGRLSPNLWNEQTYKACRGQSRGAWG